MNARGNISGRTSVQWRICAERMLKTFRAIALLAVMLGWVGSAAGLVLSTTTLTSGPNPSATGQAVILTATVTGATSSTISGAPPTGTVTFKDGTTVLGIVALAATSGGTVTLSTTFPTAGTHSLTALYSGDANTTASTSLAVVQTVQHVTRAYFIHSDHLDTPRMITDTAGNVVWQWQNSDPFGNNAPNENPSGLGQFKFDLRFPGQHYDIETGLHQNHFRDYDPALGGRYIESDPIGLAGGINGYTYVYGNPLSYVDPLGLDGSVAWLWAHLKIGSTDYDKLSANPNATGRLASLIGGRTSNKCNFFVNDALTAGGNPPGRMADGRIPSAREWANPKINISGYYVLSTVAIPRAGDVVAYDGHVGLYSDLTNGADGTISASAIEQKVVENDWGFKKGQIPTIRRCECDR